MSNQGRLALNRIFRWFSFSNVVACLALFIALGGSVYAAGKINGKQIKRNSVPGNRIKPKTIPANRIKPKSLTGTQVKANSLTGAQINQKTLNQVSASALSAVQYEAATTSLPASGNRATVTANCPAGTQVIGGGATVIDPEEADVSQSGPTPTRTGWTASAYSWHSGNMLTVTAVCVTVEKPGGATTNVPPSVAAPQYKPAG